MPIGNVYRSDISGLLRRCCSVPLSHCRSRYIVLAHYRKIRCHHKVSDELCIQLSRYKFRLIRLLKHILKICFNRLINKFYGRCKNGNTPSVKSQNLQGVIFHTIRRFSLLPYSNIANLCIILFKIAFSQSLQNELFNNLFNNISSSSARYCCS